MDGLIVREPYAMQLVIGKKKREFRRTKLPIDKIGKKILILTPQKDGGLILGYVVFSESILSGTDGYEWIVKESDVCDDFGKYKISPGCVIWVKDVCHADTHMFFSGDKVKESEFNEI